MQPVGQGDGDSIDLRPRDQLLMRSVARAWEPLDEPRQPLRIDVCAACQPRSFQRLNGASMAAGDPPRADDAEIDRVGNDATSRSARNSARVCFRFAPRSGISFYDAPARCFQRTVQRRTRSSTAGVMPVPGLLSRGERSWIIAAPAQA
jgi:hypothetical protein